MVNRFWLTISKRHVWWAQAAQVWCHIWQDGAQLIGRMVLIQGLVRSPEFNGQLGPYFGIGVQGAKTAKKCCFSRCWYMFFFGMLSGDLTISYLSECRTYYSNRMIVGMVGNGKITLKWIGWMIFHGVGCHTMRNRCWSSIWPYGITWLGEVPNGQSICGSNFWLTTHFWNLVLF